MKPRLLRNGLTGRVYVLTRYREHPAGAIEAITKYDVTEDFVTLSAKLGLDVERLAKAMDIADPGVDNAGDDEEEDHLAHLEYARDIAPIYARLDSTDSEGR